MVSTGAAVVVVSTGAAVVVVSTGTSTSPTTMVTAVPTGTSSSGGGLWEMTRPALGLLTGNAWNRTLTSKPAPCKATVADSWVRLTTGGTGTGAGPDETTIVTSSPGASSVLDSGSVRNTIPSATSSLNSSIVVARQPSWTMMFMASSTGRLARSGSRSTGGPDDTKMTIRAVASTGLPAGGFCSTT